MKLSRMIIWLLLGTACAWVLMMWFVPESHQDGLFLCSGKEYQFYDFFCPRSVLSSNRPYVDIGMSSANGPVQRADQCYPALAVFLVGLFPESVAGALVCQTMGAIIYLFGAFLLFRKYDVPARLPLASLLVSSPFLFSVEVGNLILHAAGALFVFMAWYDSEKRSRRIWAAVALAAAAVLKITPAILGLAWLCSPRKRNWRGALLSGALFVLLLTVPFAFLGGLEGFTAWIENARTNSQIYALRNTFGLYGFVAELIRVVGYNAEVLPIVHAPLRLFSSLFAGVLLVRAFARGTDDFSRLGLLTLGMLFLPPTMMRYTVLYVIPLFIVGTLRSTDAGARTFGLCWLAGCIPLQIPLLLGSANVCFATAAMLDLCRMLLRKTTPSDTTNVKYANDQLC